MIKRILVITISVLLLVSASFDVLAHSGKTDGSGGHTNHSTGEYHYHHGYSAHDHYDMDDDGVVDCPYKFKDKTGQSSSTSISNATTSKKSQKNKSNGIDWAAAICLLCVVFMIPKRKK